MVSRFVYWIVGILEALLAFRLVFKLLGANAGSSFVSTIYNISAPFVAPFSGIFRTAVNTGIETKSVLEPATIIAMLVYGLIGYGIVRFIGIGEKPTQTTRETIKETITDK
jgi:uncharacterized membrane protein YuzA (DUF378 family)